MRAHLKQVQDANNGSLSRYKAREAEEERDTIELASAQLSPGQARLGQSASRHSHRLHEMPVSQGSREREMVKRKGQEGAQLEGGIGS